MNFNRNGKLPQEVQLNFNQKYKYIDSVQTYRHCGMKILVPYLDVMYISALA